MIQIMLHQYKTNRNCFRNLLPYSLFFPLIVTRFMFLESPPPTKKWLGGGNLRFWALHLETASIRSDVCPKTCVLSTTFFKFLILVFPSKFLTFFCFLELFFVRYILLNRPFPRDLINWFNVGKSTRHCFTCFVEQIYSHKNNTEQRSLCIVLPIENNKLYSFID